MKLKDQISQELRDFIEQTLPVLYERVDYAHQWNLHIKEVINYSFEIAELITKHRKIELNANIIYVSAAYHDIGLLKGRDDHEKNSAIFIKTKAKKDLEQWFNEKEIKIIAEAVEDHRASVGRKARNIYSEIIADADKINSADRLLLRCWLYRINSVKQDLSNRDIIFESIYSHVSEKYGIEGYSKLQSPEGTEINKDFRAEITKIANDKNLCKVTFNKLIESGYLPRPSEIHNKKHKPVYLKW